MAQAAETLTPVSLELGGKDPMIVLADADLERAANAAVSYGLNNSGQVCISVERDLRRGRQSTTSSSSALTEKVEGLRQGPPGRAGHRRRRRDHLPAAARPDRRPRQRRGREAAPGCVTGGKRGEGPGRFYEPTVLAGRRPLDALHDRGDLRPDAAGDAGRRRRGGGRGSPTTAPTASRRRSGRATRRGEELARRIEAGVACVNDAQVNYAALELPMGGWKESGLGSRHGPDGIRKYTQAAVAADHARRRARPRRAQLPLQRARSPGRSARRSPRSRTSELFDDAQRATLRALCDTFIPSLEPPEGDEANRGFWARAASRHGGPRGGRDRAAAGRARRRSRSRASAALLDSLAENGMAAGAPAGGARADRQRLLRGRARRRWPGSRPCAASAGRSSTRSPTSGPGRNPNWDAIGYPGPQAPPPADASGRSASAAPSAPRRRSRPTSASSAPAPAAA